MGESLGEIDKLNLCCVFMSACLSPFLLGMFKGKDVALGTGKYSENDQDEDGSSLGLRPRELLQTKGYISQYTLQGVYGLIANDINEGIISLMNV